GILITSLEENLTVLSKTFGVIGDLTSKLQGPIGGFLDLTQSVGGFLDRATKGIPVLDGFFDPLSKSGADADKQIEKTSKKLAEILAQLEQSGGGPSAVNEAVVSMQKLVAELEKGSPAAQQLARDVQGIIEQLQAGANPPDLKIPVSLEAPTKQEIFADIQDQVNRLKQSLAEVASPAAGFAAITQSGTALHLVLATRVSGV